MDRGHAVVNRDEIGHVPRHAQWRIGAMALVWVAVAHAHEPPLPPMVSEALVCAAPLPADGNGALCALDVAGAPARWYWFRPGVGGEDVSWLLPRYWGVETLHRSPSGRYIAIFTAAEGHPELAVHDLAAIRKGVRKPPLGAVDPYPGSVHVRGWEGDTLVLESNVDLINGVRGEREPGSRWRRFALQLPRGRLQALGPVGAEEKQ